MNETLRTTLYLAVAGALAMAAVRMDRAPAAPAPEAFSLQGEPFFPEFTDFAKATSLEVWDFDASAAEAIPFKIEFKDGVWRIPSKNNYPADAGDRLGEVAAKLANLRRGALRARFEQDHADYGVVDPLADLQQSMERGRRIKLLDAQGQILADLIVGKEVPDHPGKRFVRCPTGPDPNRVYEAELALELSTRFSGWIETDLLKLDVAQICSVTINRYQVDESRLHRTGELGLIGEDQIFLGQDVEGAWRVVDQPDDMQVSPAAISSLTETLGQLEIADVLPFSYDVLEPLGFFVTQDRSVYSNEGEVRIDLRSGVRYTIRFGEVVPGGTGEGERLRRYAIVDAEVRFDALPEATDAAKDAAKKQAKRLMQRFGGWYYVISAESFEALRPSRKQLLEPKPPEEAAPLGPPGPGGMFPPLPGEEEPGHEGHDHAAPGEETTPAPGEETSPAPSEGTTPAPGEGPEEGAQPAEPDSEGALMPAELLDRAAGLEAEGKLSEALELAEDGLERFPGDPQLEALVGQLRGRLQAEVPAQVLAGIEALEAEGKLAEALQAAEGALAAHPGDAHLLSLIEQLRGQLEPSPEPSPGPSPEPSASPAPQ